MKKQIFTVIASVLLCSLLLTSLLSCADSSVEADSSADNQTSAVTHDTSAESEQTTETAAPESSNRADGPIGGSAMCEVHDHTQYHFVPTDLIEFIGKDEFREWDKLVSAAESSDGCPFPDYNIYNLVHHFSIPRNVLSDAYYGIGGCYYTNVWDIETIYNGTFEEYDAFNRDTERMIATVQSRENVRRAKQSIKRDYADTWGEKFDFDGIYAMLSVHEIALAFDISEDALRNYFPIDQEKLAAGYSYDYDFSAIYDENGNIRPLNASLSGMQRDALFCRIDDFLID